MKNQTILTLTFVEKVYKTELGKKGRTLSETIMSDRKETFTGINKSDCRQQAKANFRNTTDWIESWN